MSLYFIDVETTALKDGDIIQFAGGTLNGDVIPCYYGTDKTIDFEAMAAHHITPKKIAGLPKFDAQNEDYIGFKGGVDGGLILVAHNAEFDMGVLKAHGIDAQKYICTLRVARYMFQKDDTFKRFSLQYLRYRLGIDVEADAHDAGGDVRVLIELFRILFLEAKKKVQDDQIIINTFLTITQNPIILHRVEFGKYKGKTWAEAGKDRNYLEWLRDKAPDLMADKDIAHTVNAYLNPKQ